MGKELFKIKSQCKNNVNVICARGGGGGWLEVQRRLIEKVDMKQQSISKLGISSAIINHCLMNLPAFWHEWRLSVGRVFSASGSKLFPCEIMHSRGTGDSLITEARYKCNIYCDNNNQVESIICNLLGQVVERFRCGGMAVVFSAITAFRVFQEKLYYQNNKLKGNVI